MSIRSICLASTAMVAAVCGASVDLAAQSLAVEEITVTARKREESLLEIPVAITAFSADEIERSGATRLEDITVRTAGVQFHTQGGQSPGRINTAVRFRGMDTNQSAPSQQVGTVFIDGVYVANGVQSLDLQSLERVEIIKGPQSATFGRSTFGGAINYVTKTPGFEPEGRVSAMIAENGTYDVSISHEGPIIDDQLAYRLSVRGFGTDGQYRSNTDGGRLGEERTESATLVVFAQPNDDLSIRTRVFFAQDADGPPSGILIGGANVNFGNGPNLQNCNALDPSRTAIDYFCGNLDNIIADAGLSFHDLTTSNTVLPSGLIPVFDADSITETLSGNVVDKVAGLPRLSGLGLKRNQWRVGANIDYTAPSGLLEGYDFSLLGGYSRFAANFIRDFDGTAAPGWISQDPQFIEDYSVEGRMASPADERFRYSLGINYFDVEFVRQGNGGILAFDYEGDLNGFGIGGPILFGLGGFPIEGGQTIGVFGSAAYDITEQLTLDFEWRWQRDEITQNETFTSSFKNFLPRATLSFQPMDGTTLWATYSKGNLPGFFNTDIPGLSETELAQVRALIGEVGEFNDEEELKNYELGWKQEAFDGQLFFSAVGYFMEWTNQKTRQGVAIISDEGTPRGLNLQTNAGDSHLYGIELEGGWAFGDNLSGTFSANLAEAEYQNFTCAFSRFVEGNDAGRVNCDGLTPPRFPKWSASFSVTWTDTFVNDWDYFARLDGNYTGTSYTEEANFSTIGDFWRFNLRAGVEKENVRIEAFVNNLLDNDNILSAGRLSDFSTNSFFGFSTNQAVILTPPEERQGGVRAVYNF